MFGWPDHIAAEFELWGLCASSGLAAWPRPRRLPTPVLAFCPWEKMRAGPQPLSSCWKSNIKEDVRETRSR